MSTAWGTKTVSSLEDVIWKRPRYFKGLGPARQYQAIATLSPLPRSLSKNYHSENRLKKIFFRSRLVNMFCCCCCCWWWWWCWRLLKERACVYVCAWMRERMSERVSERKNEWEKEEIETKKRRRLGLRWPHTKLSQQEWSAIRCKRPSECFDTTKTFVRCLLH